jgi:hypothetical protein
MEDKLDRLKRMVKLTARIKEENIEVFLQLILFREMVK